ncbi:hypothetical protein EFZ10_04520 [Tatumella sp. TA1]|uniref:type II toxin-antitoxin system HicB family antitoxin n=1 Tax=Rosenbergiella collisarenosi TaxID=1544695 RepID=UPI0008F81594|nr:type II toxin-antitoxin system HicB family antitoxin [Rosenbergiella collisarenosi]MBT0721661.1 hypothetical protein [Rosenbergiella collisarenosi]QGX90959.1 hypothetical protein EFZ10_04520 [Tatumella sp. TA1]
MKYALKIEFDPNTDSYLATCRDLPLMASVGCTLADCILEASYGLQAAIELEKEQGRPEPIPSKALDNEYLVAPASNGSF